MTRLRALKLSRTYCEGDVASLAALPLETLALAECSSVDGDAASLFRPGHRLRRCDLRGTGVEGLLPILFHRCGGGPATRLDLADTLVEGPLDGVERLEHLEFLSVRGLDVTGGLAPLAGLGRLTHVDASQNEALRGNIECFRDCQGGTRARDVKGSAVFRSFRPIFGRAIVPRFGFFWNARAQNAHVSSCPGYCGALAHLDLHRSRGVYGDAAVAFDGCARLEVLDLRSTACTGAPAAFAGLPRLRSLSVGFSRISGTMAEARATLPWCAKIYGFRLTALSSSDAEEFVAQMCDREMLGDPSDGVREMMTAIAAMRPEVRPADMGDAELDRLVGGHLEGDHWTARWSRTARDARGAP